MFVCFLQMQPHHCYLGLGDIFVHWVIGFEDLLNLLLRTEDTDKTRVDNYCSWDARISNKLLLNLYALQYIILDQF